MGQVSEMILDGVLCQVCGELFDDLKPASGNVLLPPPGYPRTCEDCKKERG